MGTAPIDLDPCAGMPRVGTAFPDLGYVAGTNFPVYGPSFDGAAREDIFFTRRFPDDYAGGNLTLKGSFESAAGTTSGGVVFGARIAAQTPGDAASVETKAFATAQTSGTVTINSTAHGPTAFTITISNLDSLAAGDDFVLDFYRDPTAGGDTITTDMIVRTLQLIYPT